MTDRQTDVKEAIVDPKKAPPESSAATAAVKSPSEFLVATAIAASEYPALTIVNTIWNGFLPYRGLVPVQKDVRVGVSDDTAPPTVGGVVKPSRDKIVNDIGHFGYMRIDADRKTPRGNRVRVIIIILDPEREFARFSPDLRNLLKGIMSEKSAKNETLDEVALIVDESFFRKKNLTDVIREFQADQHSDADLKGEKAFVSLYHDYVFFMKIPEHVSTPRLQIATADEVKKFLAYQRLTLADLKSMYTNDPPVIWLGGRAGQCVKMEGDSETAGVAKDMFLLRAADI